MEQIKQHILSFPFLSFPFLSFPFLSNCTAGGRIYSLTELASSIESDPIQGQGRGAKKAQPNPIQSKGRGGEGRGGVETAGGSFWAAAGGL